MRYADANMKFVLCFIGLLLTNISLADERVEVVATEGRVMEVDPLGKTRIPVQPHSILSTGNVLSTGPNARAVVRVGSDGFIVIGKNSQIEINKAKKNVGFFRQISGIVYYAINSIKGNKHRIEVKTSSATIGIRGTRFIVTDLDGLNEIGMRKGLVSVTSPEGEFEIHKEKEQDEFEAFKQEAAVSIAKEKREFEAYNANNKKEFIEYKREFGLAANHMASFDGKRVIERPLSGETKNNMESLESYSEKWLNEVRD